MSRYLAFKLAFEALALTGMPKAIRRFSSCRGLIFTLHRVLPEAPNPFAPNAILQVTPDFLEAAIVKARAEGFDIVDLDEALRRLSAPDRGRRFVVITFDDAYRDNLEHALPVLRKHEAPFTLFVPTAFVDGLGELWWQALEDIIGANDIVVTSTADGPRYNDARTVEEKTKLYNVLYWEFRSIPEADRIARMAELASRYDYDLHAHCRQLVMTWSELAVLARDPLCSIGAHTVNHYELSKLSDEEVRSEIALSISIIEAQLGVRPRHFSYPIGSRRAAGAREYTIARELGCASGVTTIPGGLYAHHVATPHTLPRVSLNGNFQNRRYLDAMLTGALFTAISKLDKGPSR